MSDPWVAGLGGSLLGEGLRVDHSRDSRGGTHQLKLGVPVACRDDIEIFLYNM